jgi:hypothetical protein
VRHWLLIGGLVALTAAGSAGAAEKPRLRLVALTPKVVVRGLSFHSGEHVTLRLVGRRTTRVTMTASATGSFRAVLTRPEPLVCGRLILVAKGSAGSSAIARIGPPECNPPGDLNR